MKDKEKIYEYKDIIYKLYSIEGRNKSYISRLLDVDRKNLGYIINNEWRLQKAQKIHLTPSNQKYLNKNKKILEQGLKKNKVLMEICRENNLDYNRILNCVKADDKLKKLYEQNKNNRKRERINKKNNKERESKENSYLKYDFKNLPNEEWKTLPNAKNYQVSNMGRMRSYKKTYDNWVLLSPNKNKNGRMYIQYVDDDGIKHGGILARIVAFNFVEGHSKERNTVNHKDGNVLNNNAENLEWVIQSENNKHSYRKLGRKNKQYTSNIKKIIYKDKYEFKTVAALARFLNKSETQTRRYLDNPEKHNLKIIYKKDNCND